MKTLLLPLSICILFFASCSQDNITTTDNIIEADIQKRNDYECVQNDPCDSNYVFRLKDPRVEYHCISIIFDPALETEELYCLRQAYFECFSYLHLEVSEPGSIEDEIWCYPLDLHIPSRTKALSETIVRDPRLRTKE